MTIDPNDPFAGITECFTHPHGMQEDCEFCKAEYAAKTDVLNQIHAEVSKTTADLARAGMQPMPGMVVMDVRMEVLLDSLMKDRNRIHYEIEVGRRLLGLLAEATLQAQSKQNRLLVPTGKRGIQVPVTGFGSGLKKG